MRGGEGKEGGEDGEGGEIHFDFFFFALRLFLPIWTGLIGQDRRWKKEKKRTEGNTLLKLENSIHHDRNGISLHSYKKPQLFVSIGVASLSIPKGNDPFD